jgi:hypothetical protein
MAAGEEPKRGKGLKLVAGLVWGGGGRGGTRDEDYWLIRSESPVISTHVLCGSLPHKCFSKLILYIILYCFFIILLEEALAVSLELSFMRKQGVFNMD